MKFKIKVKKKGEDQIDLSLIGELTVYCVKKLKTILIKKLHKYTKVKFILSEISKIDSAGFQLLMFLKIEAEKKKKSVELTSNSDSVKSLFALYGEEL